MPITFHVRYAGCVFIDSSHARTITSAQRTRSASGASYSHMAQHQYLCLSVGASGCWSMTSTPVHPTPPSNEISTRITLRPPPEYA